MARRQAVACLLSLLLAVPASAAESLGIVLQAVHAQVRGTPLAQSNNIFSGDIVSVGPGGLANISLTGVGILLIRESSQVRIYQEAGETKLSLVAGSTVFCLSSEPVVLSEKAADNLVQAVGPSASVSQQEPKGARTVRSGGRAITLEKGQCVQLTLSDKVPAAAQPGTVTISGKTILIYGGVTAAAITLFFAFHHGDGLTRQQQQNLVSPFRIP